MTDSISQVLLALRVDRRWRQEDLAVAAGVSRRSVSKLENEVLIGGVNILVLTQVLGALGYELSIRQKTPPTLDDLLREQGVVERGGASRVRKTRAELRIAGQGS